MSDVQRNLELLTACGVDPGEMLPYRVLSGDRLSPEGVEADALAVVVLIAQDVALDPVGLREFFQSCADGIPLVERDGD